MRLSGIGGALGHLRRLYGVSRFSVRLGGNIVRVSDEPRWSTSNIVGKFISSSIAFISRERGE